ncbi:helicase associated domain-containing protein [Pseudactinotalea sp. Z1748]|uniref:helicase associated domain-containing protein n=1 Tax=Pseudactinotalea sp. Z1748 TaxID=3413027 RepID=UPI003C7D4D38
MARKRVSFKERIQQYAAFRVEHGRDPSEGSSDRHEKVIARWLHYQRWAARRGRLAPERVQLLDEVNPHWSQQRHRPRALFDQRLREYAAFLATRGRDPSRKTKSASQEKLCAPRAQAPDAAVPGWRTGSGGAG